MNDISEEQERIQRQIDEQIYEAEQQAREAEQEVKPKPKRRLGQASAEESYLGVQNKQNGKSEEEQLKPKRHKEKIPC